MFNFINRLRNFDIKKITPVQVAIGIVVAVVVLGVLNFLLSLANTLLPLLLGGAALYLGYQWLTSRSEDVDAKLNAIKREEALEKAKTAPESKTKPVTQAHEERVSRLSVEQLENPETGIKETNMQLLLEREEALKKAEDEVKQNVQAQIEERRKRLLGGEE